MRCSGAARGYWTGMRRRMCVCACALLLLLCGALAHAFPDKRAEMSPVPFVMGSRYGRSPARPLSPRNDRFFLGSRYGKRAGVTSPRALLHCEYTGFYPLYRCERDTPPPPQPLPRRPLSLRRYLDDSSSAEVSRADHD